ncbi:MAG TPA: tyrosine-type recombinase/integrase, partial [Gemmatimonadales bacterium]
LEGGFVTIVSGRGGHRVKGGRTRHVPLTPPLREALRNHFAAHRFAAYDGRRPEYVFHHTRTRRHYKAAERVHSFRRAVVNAAERAKLPDQWVMHDLRHRRATKWLAEGKSPVLVKEALGHADLRTTMSYTHLAKEHLRALVEPTRPAQEQAR